MNDILIERITEFVFNHMVFAMVVLFLILFIIYRTCRYYWNVYTGRWITTMNHLLKDEMRAGKRIIYVEMMSREQIDRAIESFIEMYDSDELHVERPDIEETATGYTLTLKNSTTYDLFCYWVNYIVYSDEKKRFNKNVSALYEVPADAEGVWRQFAGERLRFYIPEADNECDNVYFSTHDNRHFKQEFAGPLIPLDVVVNKHSIVPIVISLEVVAVVAGSVFVLNRQCSRGDVSEIDSTFVEGSAVQALDKETVTEPYVPADTSKLGWVTRLIACGNAKALVSMMDFPIRRKYPLHDIKDAGEFKQRFDEIFDKGFRERVARKESAKWYNHGYRGYCYGKSGDLWVYEKLYLIDYYSPQEQSRYLQLVKEEMGSLHESLGGKEWRPYCCFKVDNGGIVRVDYAQRKEYRAENVNIDKQAQAVPQLQPIKLRGDEVFRMSLYSKGSDLHGMPRRIMYGKVVIGGSLSSRDHQFVDEDGNTVTFGDPFYDDELILFTGAHGGNGMFEQRHTDGYKLTPCYWLDLINL